MFGYKNNACNCEMGFEQPSPIQAQSIPIAVEGKDMIGQARTGTGKTASFGIPMLQRINPKDKNLRQSSCAQRENLQFNPPMKFAN